MKVDHIQTSFAGGEWGGSLVGRTDLDQYTSASAIIENMLVRPFGSVISAPGSEYVATASISATKVRVIPFIFSRTDAYTIEMGVGYFRFLTEDGLVASTGTTPFVVTHPFTESQLFDVQFTQKNDVIWIFHPAHRTQRLIRQNASYWTLEYYDFVCTPFMGDNTEVTTLTVSNSTGTINITASGALFTPSSGTTRGHWGTFWKIGSVLTDSTTGIDVQGYVKITDVISTTVVTASVIATLSVTTATTSWAEPAWTDENGYPGSGTFFEGRLYTARSDQEPQKTWGSKPFIYDDFSLNGGADDDGINIELSSNESNEILWLTAGRSLIAGTFGGQFTISGGADNAITPTNIIVKQQTSWGSERLMPRRIGNFFFFVQRFGRKLRELFYFWDLDSYKAVDKTIMSPHILDKGVVDMAYQQNPDTIIYCVLTNGTIATMTREIDQEMTAWSRQKTAVGTYTSICAIPSSTELYDQIWVVCERWITDTAGTAVMKKYIEVFKNIDVPDRQDMCWYLHSALRYSAYDATNALESKTLTVTGMSLSKTSGTSVTVTTSADYFESNDKGQRIRAVNAEGVTLGELKIVSYGTATLVVGDIVYDFDALSYSGGEWGVSVSSISGLSHLEGMTVGVLADGGLDKPSKTVSLGSINFAYDYFVTLIGLPYTQKLRTLPADQGSKRGTSQGKIQRIAQVAFKVNRSFKGFKTGGTDALAEKIVFRDPTTLMGTPEALYTGTLPNINFVDDYRYGSQISVINEEPLPVEILSIISFMDTKDK